MVERNIIIDSGGSARRNDSEYLLDTFELDQRPDWLQEDDGYRDRASDSEDSVTRQYVVPWSRRFEARERLLGYSYTELLPVAADELAAALAFYDLAIPPAATPAVVARLRRVIPMQDPERPWLFCSEVETLKGDGAWIESPDNYVIGPSGKPFLDLDGLPRLAPAIHYVDNSEAGFAGERQLLDDLNIVPVAGEPDFIDVPPTRRYRDGRARLRAIFRPRDYTVINDVTLDERGRFELRRYVSRQEDFGLEALPLAKLAAFGGLKFSEGQFKNIIIPEAGVQQYPLGTLSYTWHNVPDPPRTHYYSCLGRINAEAFDGMGGAPSYPAETLLCLPWKLKRETGPTGRVQWDIQYRFSFRPQRWNRFPAGDGEFYKATWGGTAAGKTVFLKADFNLLFRVPPPERYNF